MKKLTTKQQRFVEVFDGNATEAAREAGYKGNDVTLAQVGAENLKKPHIVAAIKERETERQSSKIATREERQAFWTDVMRGNITQDSVEGKGEDAVVVKIPPDMKDRLRAAELLGKSEGDFIERKEVSGPGGGPVQTRAEIVDELLDSVDGATRGLPKPRQDK
ncbi:MAG: terminase small subunit [Desulfobacteraceae bacterium]|nr:terminase small subunit [Desulfobacteraceae bacterium]